MLIGRPKEQDEPRLLRFGKAIVFEADRPVQHLSKQSLVSISQNMLHIGDF